MYCIGKTNKTGIVEIPKYDSICINKCSDLYNNSIPNLFSRGEFMPMQADEIKI